MKRLLCIVALLLSGSASFGDEADATKEIARKHFKSGMASYTVERYEDAIKEFEAGFMARADPVFLFNIAQSYRLSRKPEQAMVYYQKYLRLSPDAPNRGVVQHQIVVLKRQLAEQKSAPENVVAPTENPPPVVEAPAEVQVENKTETKLALVPTQPVAVEETPHRTWPIFVGVGAGVAVAVVVVVVAVLFTRPSSMNEPFSLESAR